MSIFERIKRFLTFDWNKTQSELTTPTKVSERRPKAVNATESLTVNKELTKGLYHNTYPGLKLAGSLAYAPIAVPVWFMGIPVIKIKNNDSEEAKEFIKTLIKRYYQKFKQIHIQCHREGTIWVYPHYSAKKSMVVWDFISDDIVTDIIKDIDTNDIIKLITEEEKTIQTDYDETATIKIKKIYEQTKITTEVELISGQLHQPMNAKTVRNISGILPVPFSNNADGNEHRGHSDYERIVPDLKLYHDVEYADHVDLARFNVKLVQNVRNYDAWKNNLLTINNWTSVAEIDIAKMDFIINEPEESTSLLWPQGAHEARKEKLKTLYYKIVEGSLIPEIFWGLKTIGNHASVEESAHAINMYVIDKQDQKTSKYEVLIEKTIELEMLAGTVSFVLDLEIEWNDIDLIPPEIKAKIFTDYASGIEKCFNTATMTKDQLYKLWKDRFPKITEQEYDDFIKGLSDSAKHKQFTNLDYYSAQDMSGLENEEIEE